MSYQNLTASVQMLSVTQGFAAFSQSGDKQIPMMLQAGTDKMASFFKSLEKGDVVLISGSRIEGVSQGTSTEFYKVTVFQAVKMGRNSDVSVAQVVLEGNLGSDPRLNTTGKGTPVCNFSMNADDAWFSVTAWGNTANAAGKFLSKGSRVLVAGPLQPVEKYKSNGETRINAKVTGFRVIFLDPRKSSPQTAPQAPQDDGEEIPF